ncbi:ribosome recycling factor [Candidatus Parcubacteria bacterium]|nr:ribosome recycling factor [Candidatus Parcubacteria bacterium]
MMYQFNDLKNNLSKVKEWFTGELAGIRTGRATVALLDSVRVDSYGAQSPLNQVAGVAVEDARTIRINPYDASQVKAVEKSISDADLGVSISTDERGLRVIFPELTSERRELLVKQVGKKLEEARISVRKDREEVWNDIQEKEKTGEMTEDEKFKSKEEMEKIISDFQKELEELADNKENEIKS